jgi:hypothetical protein
MQIIKGDCVVAFIMKILHMRPEYWGHNGQIKAVKVSIWWYLAHSMIHKNGYANPPECPITNGRLRRERNVHLL